MQTQTIRPQTLRIMSLSCNAAYEAKRERAIEVTERTQEIQARADAEHRDFTDEETRELTALCDEFDVIVGELGIRKRVQDNAELLSTPRGRRTEPSPVGNRAGFSASPGRQFGRREQPESPRILGYKQTDGTPLYSFSNRQRLQDHLKGPDGISTADVSAGAWLRGALTGNWDNAEVEKQLHIKAQQSEGSDIQGGFLVPSQIAYNVIDLARSLSQVFAAGAQTVPLQSGAAFAAKVSQDPVAQWRPENVAISPSDVQFKKLLISPKTLAALVVSSLELSEDVMNFGQIVEQTMGQAIALELDRAALYGSGAGEIAGLTSPVWAGVQSIPSIGGITDWTELSQAVGKLYTANAQPTPDQPFSAILSPREAGTYDALVSSADGQPLMPTPWAAALRKLVTTQISVTEGAGSNESSIFVGDFTKMLVFLRTALVVNVDQSGDAFDALQIKIRAHLRADLMLAEDTHFVICSGITTG